MIYATGLLIVSFHFQKYRALANAIAMSGSSFGAFGLSLILQTMLSTYDRESTLRLQAALCVIAIIGSLTITMPRESTLSQPHAPRPSTLSDDMDAMQRHLQTASLETSQMLQNNSVLIDKNKKSRCSLIGNYLLIHFKHTCDFTLLQSPIFICLCLSYFILFLGQLTPFVFIIGKFLYTILKNAMYDTFGTFSRASNCKRNTIEPGQMDVAHDLCGHFDRTLSGCSNHVLSHAQCDLSY